MNITASGRNVGAMMEKGGEAQGASDPADDVDARTVFVRSLPFSLKDSQLEDVFSEVGPVRHCFTVKEKGSDQHRGFGFVQFAVTEDAHRAVQEKNGTLLQGRKIKVEIAKRRAPLDVRLPKSNTSKPEPTSLDQEQDSKSDSRKRKSKDPQTAESSKVVDGELPQSKKKLKPDGVHQTSAAVEKANVDRTGEKKKKNADEQPLKKASTETNSRNKNVKPGGKLEPEVRADQKKEYAEAQGSSKQRPARTIVVGGLASTEMLEAVLTEAKKAGEIESIQKTLTEVELNSRGLAKDGCKPRAAAIVFLSVKAACQAVAALHQKAIAGGVVWARQLGGEGSRLKQLRLIVRNLPFQVTEAMLREMFSAAGFVWEVTIPRKPDGLSKGFAFIGFTTKVHAETAIKLVNGKLLSKRPVAVDWAVAKKQYDAATTPATPVLAQDVELDESESTASESENDDDGDDDSGHDEETGDETAIPRRAHAVIRKADDTNLNKKKRGREVSKADDFEEDTPDQSNHSGHVSEDDKYSRLGRMERMDEIEMFNKVLAKVVSSAPNHYSDDEDIVGAEAIEKEPPSKKQVKSAAAVDLSTKKVTSNGKKADTVTKVEDTELAENENDGAKSKLSRTVFIRNLPPDARVPELRKLFSEFGEIKSFRLVMHPGTKRSKGNAFLEYSDQEAAQAAVAVAAKNGSEDVGLMLKGRAVSVSMAVDKDSARKIAKETFHKQVEEDKRNLALAKEGQILVGTPAAAGVSKKDMSKRQQLEHEKATKLRSPNFHVSKTRLLVHNIPKTMTEKELKKLFVEGVQSRASKQIPVVKQVKILRDEDSQKSRGAAFVEFTEHQHALVALRVLNNNPATFGVEHRPIVEFAIENSLILRKRAANAVKAKDWQSKGTQGNRTKGVNNKGEGKKVDNNSKHHPLQGETREGNGGLKPDGENLTVKDRKRKRGKDRDRATKAKEVGGEALKTAGKSGTRGELPNGEEQGIKTGRKIKRGKISGRDRKAAQASRASKKVMEGSVETGEKGGPRMLKSQTLGKKGIKKQDDQVSRVQPVKLPNLSKRILPKDGNSKNTEPIQSRVSKRETQMETKKQSRRGKGGETEDQLDKLVAEYRTKYFSGASKPSSSRGTVTTGDLRRWFD